MLSAAETEAVIPGNGRRWLGGVHSTDDGKGEPPIAAPTIADGARRFGATIHQDCAARSLDIANGSVAGVVTEKGLIRTKSVLCAGGAWTSWPEIAPASIPRPSGSRASSTAAR